MPIITRILWLSQHAPSPRQAAELRRLYPHATIDRRPVRYILNDTLDWLTLEVARRTSGSVGDGSTEVVMAGAPLSILQLACDRGILPLWPVVERVEANNPRAEWTIGNTGYVHQRFMRCYGLRIDLRDPCAGEDCDSGGNGVPDA